VHVPVHHLDEQVGRLELSLPPGGRLSSASTELLAHLARQAGVALHNVRLTDELRSRLRQLSDHNEAVAASRQRLVAARTVERQRLERQIADLVQPHLARVRAGLGEVESAVSDPERAGQLLESLAAEATTALDALRDLARGVFPPLLVDHGLLPALQAAARTAPVPVTVDVESPSEPGDVGLPRYEAVIESAAYFCLRDVLSAAMPHGPVQVTLQPTAERLRITVVGAEPPSSVLASASDRVGATGGTVGFGWTPRPTVVVELPAEGVRQVLATADA
jgi:signal transduction histidine kinase